MNDIHACSKGFFLSRKKERVGHKSKTSWEPIKKIGRHLNGINNNLHMFWGEEKK
jgi:hypothetical protein